MIWAVITLGALAIAGSLLFAGWLIRRNERRADAQLQAELEKVQLLARALVEQGQATEIEFTPDPELDDDADYETLEQITARRKKPWPPS